MTHQAAAIDPAKISERVKARSTAEAVNSLVAEVIEGLVRETAGELASDGARTLFWSIVRDETLKHAPMPAIETPRRPVLEPMTRQQAEQFEKQPMPFGSHEGEPVGFVMETAPGYLHWLASQRDEFKDQLNRYLASRPDPDDERRFL